MATVAPNHKIITVPMACTTHRKLRNEAIARSDQIPSLPHWKNDCDQGCNCQFSGAINQSELVSHTRLPEEVSHTTSCMAAVDSSFDLKCTSLLIPLFQNPFYLVWHYAEAYFGALVNGDGRRPSALQLTRFCIHCMATELHSPMLLRTWAYCLTPSRLGPR